ncbi:MAG TPA: anaerobic ribonucleoside-triphosphate reductase activating protein [Sedimentisphaerales bacterium]|nr:anaerobic ribonucleoside-triphosphate reductase activating protein [Sedimentisphaerales bacterium]HRS12499.1 anaerobic ribonucleoside-triphosphate reductase activating protein [Sedimentisphaerales bacterium]HRV49137.1 anaerobic ribonucleoside-triphosphate reductase activating protein [Sedimentisphaerales bacterium]
MRIGGFQALTLSDYAGHIAAIVFTQGCNFRCPFCHNGPLLPLDRPVAELVDEGLVLDALKSRAAFLDGVVITGGEPTLQNDLRTFIERIRTMRLKVKLDTNGSHPEVLADLLARRLLDYVAMDIKAPFARYPQLTGVDAPVEAVRESLALLAGSGTPCEFRTTFVPSLLSEHDLDEIRSYLPQGARYAVQAFVADNALDPSLRFAAAMEPDVIDDIPHHLNSYSGE